MAKEVEDGASASPGSPLKALAVATAVDLVLIPPIFVLWVYWPIYYFAIVPYVGGRLGGRFVDRGKAVRVGVLAAVIGVTVLVAVFLSFLGLIPGDTFDPLEPIGLSIVVASYLVAILFGAIGGRHGASLRDGG
jgi:hypothetical protein